MKLLKVLFFSIGCSLTQAACCFAVPVGLQNATATFSQTYVGNFVVGTAINGTTADFLGWGIYGDIRPQTAVFETTSNIGSSGGSVLTFTLNHDYSLWGQHILGRFRLSVTTDDRASFADGLPSGGDVEANWVVLEPDSYISANGATLTELADHSILASGTLPDTDIYTVTAITSLTNITGIRLEALSDPSLPFGGPGRQHEDGNFTLSEFSVEIAPDVKAPSIQKQPRSQVGYWGGNVTFDIVATGAQPMSYQWQKDGMTISGATAASLGLTNLLLTDGGAYTVVLTNISGSVTSNPAILTMNPAGVSIELYPGVTIKGVAGFTYGIQSTTTLNDTNSWTGLANVTLTAPTQLWLDFRPAAQPQRYYRVVPGPIPVP